MPFDFSYLNNRSLALFGRQLFVDNQTVTALVEFVDRFDDVRGVYYSAADIEYPAESTSVKIQRGTEVFIDGSRYQVIARPRVIDGWVTLTARSL